MSKVRRQLGILQLRRGNYTSCYWQRTDVWRKVGIQQPFFFWQKSTRQTQETRHDCHPMKERPLNIQGGWRANIFLDFTPPKHLTAGVGSIMRARVKCCVYDYNGLHTAKVWEGEWQTKKYIKIHQSINSFDPKHTATCSSHILYTNVYTSKHTRPECWQSVQ